MEHVNCCGCTLMFTLIVKSLKIIAISIVYWKKLAKSAASHDLGETSVRSPPPFPTLIGRANRFSTFLCT